MNCQDLIPEGHQPAAVAAAAAPSVLDPVSGLVPGSSDDLAPELDPALDPNLNQTAKPLFDQLQRCAQRSTAAFHTPGHRGGVGAAQALGQAWGLDMLRADLPELPERG